jgi:hypothetical protein
VKPPRLTLNGAAWPSASRSCRTSERMRLIAALAVVFVTQVHGADFASRVAEAKAAAETPEGKAYEPAIRTLIGAAMQACIPVGSSNPQNLGTFTVVGSVSKRGKLVEVELNPANNVSRCFAAKLQDSPWPMPPRSTSPDSAYPVEITMRVVP